MKRKKPLDTVIGQSVPQSLKNIEWRDSPGGGRSYGEDPYGNEWSRDRRTTFRWDENSETPKSITRTLPGYKLWTEFPSQYREAVFLPVSLNISEDGVIEDIEIEAYASTGPGHGRPSDIAPQAREKNQIIRLIKKLMEEPG
jgi:hypothetical protein